MKMKVVVDPGANIPTRAHRTDAGLDLYASKGGWILPKSRKVLDTGFHCAIPEGYVGMLTSKSGLMLRGITSRGTIDCGYTGSIKAVLFNHSWRFVRIRKGQKVTQLVIMPIALPDVEFVNGLEDTERSDGGFGSTGNFASKQKAIYTGFSNHDCAAYYRCPVCNTTFCTYSDIYENKKCTTCKTELEF